MLKVQFGCGGSKPEGWLNHDIDVPIQGKIPYADNSVDEIRAEHVCEHTDSVGLISFLDNCHRILKPGGKLRLCVPVIGMHLKKAHARDLAINHTHQHIHTPETIRIALWISGDWKFVFEGVVRDPLDHHWTVIGKELDDLETFRVVAIK